MSMDIKLITYDDLKVSNQKLLEDFGTLLRSELSGHLSKRWVRAKELQKLTGWSLSTIQTYRANGTLTYSKVGGTVFYDLDALNKQLETNSKNNNHD